MKNPFPQQWEACSTIHLPFDEFQLGHMAFYYAVIDLPDEAGAFALAGGKLADRLVAGLHYSVTHSGTLLFVDGRPCQVAGRRC